MTFNKMTFFIVASLACSLVQAAAPDMVGTWNGTTNTTVFGGGEHHTSQEDMKTARFRSVPLSFFIEQQQGSNFSGKIVSANYQEVLAGALSLDGKGGVMADQDGGMNFKLLGKNKMEVCYTHTKSTSIIAACLIAERM